MPSGSRSLVGLAYSLGPALVAHGRSRKGRTAGLHRVLLVMIGALLASCGTELPQLTAAHGVRSECPASSSDDFYFPAGALAAAGEEDFICMSASNFAWSRSTRCRKISFMACRHICSDFAQTVNAGLARRRPSGSTFRLNGWSRSVYRWCGTRTRARTPRRAAPKVERLRHPDAP